MLKEEEKVKQFLAGQLEDVEFRFDQAGLNVTAWIGEDVRTGRSWMGINDEKGDEVVRIAHHERWQLHVDAWSLYDPEDWYPITDRLAQLGFADTVKEAIAEYRKRY
jgi:hypothetical protein